MQRLSNAQITWALSGDAKELSDSSLHISAKQNVPNGSGAGAEAIDVENLITFQLLHPSSALICCNWRKRLMSSFTSLWPQSEFQNCQRWSCTVQFTDFSCSYWEEILKCCVGAERWTGKEESTTQGKDIRITRKNVQSNSQSLWAVGGKIYKHSKVKQTLGIEIHLQQEVGNLGSTRNFKRTENISQRNWCFILCLSSGNDLR